MSCPVGRCGGGTCETCVLRCALGELRLARAVVEASCKLIADDRLERLHADSGEGCDLCDALGPLNEALAAYDAGTK